MGRLDPLVPNKERINSVYLRYMLVGLNGPREGVSMWVFLVQ